MEPVTSAPVASGPMKMPSSVASWTTKLMTLVPGPLRWTPCITPCCGAGFVTSKPQNHVYAPVTKRMLVTVARSPGYWRTRIGASGVPISVLAKPLGSAAFVYIPPRNQIVLPGVTAAGPSRAVAKSHGLANDPSPEGEPVGETKNAGAKSKGRLANSGVARPGPVASCDTHAAHTRRDVSAKRTQPGSMRGNTRVPTERMTEERLASSAPAAPRSSIVRAHPRAQRPVAPKATPVAGQQRRGLSATVDFVPQFEFGHVEELQCGLGLDAMITLQDAQHCLHVVDAAFPGSPTGQDVTQGFSEGAGHPHMQRRWKAHLLDTVSHRVRYTTAQTAAEERLVPNAFHLSVGGRAEGEGDQAVVQERQASLEPVGHRVAIFQPEVVGQASPFDGASEYGVQVGVLVTLVRCGVTLEQTRCKPALLLEAAPPPPAREAAIRRETPQLLVEQTAQGAEEQACGAGLVPSRVFSHLAPGSG